MTAEILELAKKRTVLLDGAMGTELMKQGFTPDSSPELWNVEHSAEVQAVYKSYFDSGADAVLTNTLGANAIKLEAYGLESRCFELNHSAAILASVVRPNGSFIGGSIGPTGKFIKPHGTYSEDEIEQAYTEQIRGLDEGGADFFMIETQYDLKEALCALRAARRHSSLPIFITLTFNKTPRGFFTIMGDSLNKFAETMEREDVPAFGANCTLDSSEMAELAKNLRPLTQRPLIIEANSGHPVIDDSGKLTYSQNIDDYLHYIPMMIEAGVNIIGGCCGTDPDYIRRMAKIIGK